MWVYVKIEIMKMKLINKNGEICWINFHNVIGIIFGENRYSFIE